MLFATLHEPPLVGSLRESVLVMFVIMKERVDHARIRAVMQGIIDKEKGPEVFEEYMKVAFPWIETAKGREKGEHLKRLMEEIKRGPIGVTPLPGLDRKVRSRLRERVEAAAPKSVGPRPDRGGLYEKMGNMAGRRA